MSSTYERYTETKRLTPLPRPFSCAPPREVRHANIQRYEPTLSPETKKKLKDCLITLLVWFDPVFNMKDTDENLMKIVRLANKIMGEYAGIYEAIQPVRAYLCDASMCWSALQKAEQPGSTLRPDFWRGKFREAVKNVGIACEAMLKE